jgi:hypothetical protein
LLLSSDKSRQLQWLYWQGQRPCGTHMNRELMEVIADRPLEKEANHYEV